jgi:AbrB family transcriptional regulator (stage V sporulation protein T)
MEEKMTTGIIRRIDELGRIVIPKEIRTNLRIRSGDNLEILVENDSLLWRKYSHIEDITDIVTNYAEAFYQVLKYNVIITDTDRVVAVAGNLKNKYINHEISDVISTRINRRDATTSRKKDILEISPGMVEEGYYSIAVIINNGDSIGSVIILSENSPMLEQESKLAMILANILSNYFI